MHAGKPQKQSLAIAYSLMRKAKKHKMADGGDTEDNVKKVDFGGGNNYPPKFKKEWGEQLFGPNYEADEKKRQREYNQPLRDDETIGVHNGTSGGLIKLAYDAKSRANKAMNPGSSTLPQRVYQQKRELYEAERHLGSAKEEHQERLKELKSMPNPNIKGLAEGGEVRYNDYERAKKKAGYVTETHPGMTHQSDNWHKMAEGGKVGGASTSTTIEDDMDFNQKLAHGGCPECAKYAQGGDVVDRVMHKRSCQYSEGGQVANSTPEKADDMSGEYDDLVKDDTMEFHDTGANSGDYLGNDQETHDRDDIVARILHSLSKKDRMPRPA